jgi:hypothetical protein
MRRDHYEMPVNRDSAKTKLRKIFGLAKQWIKLNSL